MAVHLFGDYDTKRPTHLINQHFGMGLLPEDHLAPVPIPHFHHHLQHPHVRAAGYYRPWRIPSEDSGSVIRCDKDKFQVNLDVQQFLPEEIAVKVVDNSIIVEAKHEEKEDEHGFVSRKFQRRYTVPNDHDKEHVETKLSSDGILTITAPRINTSESSERPIPIIHTGVPYKAVPSSGTKKTSLENNEAESETNKTGPKTEEAIEK